MYTEEDLKKYDYFKDIDINYDPLKDEMGFNTIGEPDEDGFVEVKANTTKNNFSNGNVRFKIANDKIDEYDNLYKRRRKRKRNEMFYNFQVVEIFWHIHIEISI